jgi:hypothetical protein
MPCPLCNDTGEQRYWEARWRDADAENKKLRGELSEARASIVCAAADWFTLSPQYRTKERLIEMLSGQ